MSRLDSPWECKSQGKQEKWECLAVAEARTARSLQQQHRLWPASKPINSYTASRTTSRQTRRAAVLGDHCHNMCFWCKTVTKKEGEQKKKKRRSNTAITGGTQREAANATEELATPLHSGRKQPTSSGSPSSSQRGSPHVKERIYFPRLNLWL